MTDTLRLQQPEHFAILVVGGAMAGAFQAPLA